MRAGLFLVFLGARAVLAQAALEATKQDALVGGERSAGPPLGTIAIVQMVLAVGLVIGALKFFLPRLIPKLGKKLNPTLGSLIRVQETAQFAGGTLYVVEAKGKTLLLCQSQTGVGCLADLSDPDPKVDTPAFFELLQNAGARTSSAVVEVEPETPSNQQIAEQLRRLSKLTKK